MKNKHILVILIILFGISCSALPQRKVQREDRSILETDHERTTDLVGIYDPWEPFNRRMYYFNAKLDRYVFLPTVKVYKTVTPDPMEKGIHNFFKNLGEVKTFSNSVLQGDTKKSLITLNRFVINSTFGIFGIFDVATKVGLQRQKEDFGLTLAHYGVKEGPYLVLPIFGPSTVRDATGLGVDTVFRGYADPLEVTTNTSQSNIGVTALDAVDTRANIGFRYHGTGSPFEYEYVRYLYFKLRELEGANGMSKKAN